MKIFLSILGIFLVFSAISGHGSEKKNLSESPESLNGDFIYIYFSADKPPTEEIPSEAPLCYKFKVKSIEAQLLKIKKKYPELYDYQITTSSDNSKNIYSKTQ